MTRHRVLLDLGILATATREHGIGRYVCELARGLVAIRNEWQELDVAFLERLGPTGQVVVSHELEPAIARLTATPTRARYGWAYPLRLFAGHAARRSGARLLHLPTPGATPLWLGSAASVVTCHDLIPYKYPAHYTRLGDGYRWGRRALDRRRYRSADRVIAISRATAGDLEQQLALGSNRVSVVSSGVDAARWQPLSRERDAEQLEQLGLTGRRFITYVGDADWRKNSEGMMRALAIARQSEPELELVWVGKPSGAAHDRVRRLEAERAGVTGAVRFVGYVSDAALGAIYRAALATLLVSRAEGFGYPVLEAMAAGCPVIASNVSSLPEVAGDAALLVDPEAPSAIADAIVRLARDPALRLELLNAGSKRAKSLNLLAQARGTLEVYRSVLAASSEF